jgi:hypothetical protein
MKIKLVFYQWKSKEFENLRGSERMALEKGFFHAGATFRGEINLSKEQEEELKLSVPLGARALFAVYLTGEVEK